MLEDLLTIYYYYNVWSKLAWLRRETSEVTCPLSMRLRTTFHGLHDLDSKLLQLRVRELLQGSSGVLPITCSLVVSPNIGVES